MKKYLLILTAAMTVMACSNDEEDLEVKAPVVEEQIEDGDETSEYTLEMEGIVGNWCLMGVNRGFGGVQTFEPDEISYCFYNHGPLVVQDTSGKDRAVFHPAGTYEYSFDEEAGTITIDGSTYRCVLEDNNLTIDTGSAWDGPIFAFVRRTRGVEM